MQGATTGNINKLPIFSLVESSTSNRRYRSVGRAMER